MVVLVFRLDNAQINIDQERKTGKAFAFVT